jgi:hypothetical protein
MSASVGLGRSTVILLSFSELMVLPGILGQNVLFRNAVETGEVLNRRWRRFL